MLELDKYHPIDATPLTQDVIPTGFTELDAALGIGGWSIV